MARRPRKKTPDTPPAPEPLGRAEAFYVEQHFGQKDAATLAAELNIDIARVVAYQEALIKAGVTPAQKPRRDHEQLKRAGYLVKDGVVAMDQRGADLGDENHRRRRPASRFWEKRLGGCAHPIFPDETPAP